MRILGLVEEFGVGKSLLLSMAFGVVVWSTKSGLGTTSVAIYHLEGSQHVFEYITSCTWSTEMKRNTLCVDENHLKVVRTASGSVITIHDFEIQVVHC
jgi:Fe-S cluster biosynthesis and repair protein YggX